MAAWLIVGKPANLASLLCGWMNSRAFLSPVEGVQLQLTGLHPGTDLSQARQKAGKESVASGIKMMCSSVFLEVQLSHKIHHTFKKDAE